ncbi:ribonuclease P protein subunit p25a [Alosa sapidissima]|uniref:ribonuclease P protein subunit p25a n=1 Tax=Alosa sapidissima TaxID=34773 RepID=UPI001C09C267|nr:ribonuclease P protein subunit p25a [Alosa sapidissima]
MMSLTAQRACVMASGRGGPPPAWTTLPPCSSLKPARSGFRKVSSAGEADSCPIPGLPEGVLEMRVKEGSKIRNLLGFAMARMQGGLQHGGRTPLRQILFTGSGRAITKTITCAEIMKRQIRGLHQLSKLQYRTVQEQWEGRDSACSRMTIHRMLPAIYILLSKEPLDTHEPGYQPPEDLLNPNGPGYQHLVELKPCELGYQHLVEVEPGEMRCQPPVELEPCEMRCQPPVELEPREMRYQPPVELEPSDMRYQHLVELEPCEMRCQPPVELEPRVMRYQPPVELEPSEMRYQHLVELEPRVMRYQPPVELEPCEMRYQSPVLQAAPESRKPGEHLNSPPDHYSMLGYRPPVDPYTPSHPQTQAEPLYPLSARSRPGHLHSGDLDSVSQRSKLGYQTSAEPWPLLHPHQAGERLCVRAEERKTLCQASRKRPLSPCSPSCEPQDKAALYEDGNV